MARVIGEAEYRTELEEVFWQGSPRLMPFKLFRCKCGLVS